MVNLKRDREIVNHWHSQQKKWSQRLARADSYQQFVKQYKQGTFRKYGVELSHRRALTKASLRWRERENMFSFDLNFPEMVVAVNGTDWAIFGHSPFRDRIPSGFSVDNQHYECVDFSQPMYSGCLRDLEAKAKAKTENILKGSYDYQ